MEEEKNVFGLLKTTFVVMIAEVPCMLRTVAMQVKNQTIWDVLLGTIIGSAIALMFGLIIAHYITINISASARNIDIMAGIIFIGIGICIIMEWH